ncbi:hypothetical protein L6452_13962 [Arctium lappa]|uniref:Uncharacterized protein n=1 Tax=Arctium lappa TaxID=4217 RepID=A0ACB9CJN8_ARCLA|nr:hypothetical protein L6452_13962 [Arctium lappa]
MPMRNRDPKLGYSRSKAPRERIARIKELKGKAESDIQRGLTEYVNEDAALWDIPTYVGEVDESRRVSIENSKAKRFLNAIEPPGIDLVISPMKDAKYGGFGQSEACSSRLRADKGKGKLFDETKIQKFGTSKLE